MENGTTISLTCTNSFIMFRKGTNYTLRKCGEKLYCVTSNGKLYGLYFSMSDDDIKDNFVEQTKEKQIK